MRIKQYCFLLAVFLILLPASVFSRDFTPMAEALKAVLPAGDQLFREEVKLTKAQVDYLNRTFESDYMADEKLTVYYTKNGAGTVSGFAIVLEDILWQYVAYHKWALGYTPTGNLKAIRIITLKDEYTFNMPDPRFLAQFENKAPKSITMPGNVDAMTGATMSSKMLVGSTIKGWEIIRYSKAGSAQ